LSKTLSVYNDDGLSGVVDKLEYRLIHNARQSRPIWSPRQLYIPLEGVKIKDPVFFLGVQGGGLTIVSRCVRRSGGFVTIGGSSEFWTGFDEMDKYPYGRNLLPGDFTIHSPGYDNMDGDEKDHPIFGVERHWVYACNELVNEYIKTEKDYSPKKEKRLKNFIRRSIRAYSNTGRKARFLDMSQTFSLKVPLLRKIFPEASFVVVARNPYAVCKRASPNYPNRKYRFWNEKLSKDEVLKVSSEHWKNTYLRALKDTENMDGRMIVKIEDFVNSPEKEIKKICNACNVQLNNKMIPSENHNIPVGSRAPQKWYPVRKKVNKKYIDNLEESEAKIIEHKLGDLASKLGYKYPL
jgi:hypothetical protein